MRTSLPAFVAATIFLPAAALAAQTTGTAHPEAIEETITTTAVTTVTAKPSAATAVEARPVLQTRTVQAVSVQEDTEAKARTTESAEATPPIMRRIPSAAELREEAPRSANPLDEGIVTSLPYHANALSEGTMLRARLDQEISSKTAEQGSRFTARLTTEVMHDGKVVFPQGTLLSGRITSVSPGHRIGGVASMHLEPDTITLPDGTSFRMDARIIDTDDFRNSRVNGEGTIIRTQHAKATLAALGLTTGSAAVAGAVIGGGVGAVVGAGVGVGIGTAWWLRRDRSETLAEGTQLIFSLDRPLELTPIAVAASAIPAAD